ncbi:M67 family metallopeptidase [Methylococcaceae bacterium WWC4]|nr:M67 family metallopeptidase [Methylococcaceae bacterium WWC4]
MNRPEIQLPRKLTNQLLHLAQQSPEAEVCGLIGADAGGKPISCYPIANDAETPGTRFLLDSRQQIAAMKQMRDKGETLFAIYHSHPSAPAVPSPADIEQSGYPTALQLIVSLNTKGVLELRAFQIHNGVSREAVLTMTES